MKEKSTPTPILTKKSRINVSNTWTSNLFKIKGKIPKSLRPDSNTLLRYIEKVKKQKQKKSIPMAILPEKSEISVLDSWKNNFMRIRGKTLKNKVQTNEKVPTNEKVIESVVHILLSLKDDKESEGNSKTAMEKPINKKRLRETIQQGPKAKKYKTRKGV
jgi:hypothetical protein